MTMQIKQFFHPFQKAQVDEADNSLMRFKKLSFITAIGGYHSIDLREEDSDIPLFLRCLMPNLEMLWDPESAYKSSQHIGLGTYLTNPLLPLVLLLRVSLMNEELKEKEENETALRSAQDRAARTGFDAHYTQKHTDNTFIKFQLALLSIIVLLIDALKMIVTYALVLPALPIALPIMKYLDNKRSTSLVEVDAQQENVGTGPSLSADADDDVDLSSSHQPGKSG